MLGPTFFRKLKVFSANFQSDEKERNLLGLFQQSAPRVMAFLGVVVGIPENLLFVLARRILPPSIQARADRRSRPPKIFKKIFFIYILRKLFKTLAKKYHGICRNFLKKILLSYGSLASFQQADGRHYANTKRLKYRQEVLTRDKQ